MKQILKEYKTQIAIIVGAIIIAFAIYFSMTAEYRNKVKVCMKEHDRYGPNTIEEHKSWCTNMIARYGRW